MAPNKELTDTKELAKVLRVKGDEKKHSTML